MKPEEIMVRAVLFVMLVFLVGVTASSLAQADVAPFAIIMWCVTVVLFAGFIGTLIKVIPKSFRTGLLACSLLLGLLTFLLQSHIIPICCDKICSTGECSFCPEDCSPAVCQDGVCETGVEQCDTSADCACNPGFACAPGRPGADKQGCIVSRCGDGYCDSHEGPDNCCMDCGCRNEYQCQSNVCYFQLPRVAFTPLLLAPKISATSLAGNPLLTDDDNNPRPLMAVRLSVSRVAQNMNITFAIDNLTQSTVDVGTMYDGQNATVFWYVPPSDKFLTVSGDLYTNISMEIQYVDAINELHVIQRSFPIIVADRNTLDKYGHIVLFATQDVAPASDTPDGIWDDVRQGMTILPLNASHVQFPIETYTKKQGSGQDVAVLLASMYELAGLQPSLVDTQDGMFVRVRTGDHFSIIDPSLVNVTFDEAISYRPGSAVYDLPFTRKSRNFLLLSVNKTLLQGVSVTTNLVQICSNDWRIVAIHEITNPTSVDKTVCVSSKFVDKDVFDERDECFELYAGKSVEFRHGYRDFGCKGVKVQVDVS